MKAQCSRRKREQKPYERAHLHFASRPVPLEEGLLRECAGADLVLWRAWWPLGVLLSSEVPLSRPGSLAS